MLMLDCAHGRQRGREEKRKNKEQDAARGGNWTFKRMGEKWDIHSGEGSPSDVALQAEYLGTRYERKE